MPFNGSGQFSRLYSWIADAAAGIFITASRMDADTNDIVTSGLDNALTRDGQGIATANLPMGGFRHTGVGAGVGRTDYAQLAQLQNGAPIWGATAGGTANALTLSLMPALTAYSGGQRFSFLALATNTGPATINIDGVGIVNIMRSGPTGPAALVGGEMPIGAPIQLAYDGTEFILTGIGGAGSGVTFCGTTGGSANAQTLSTAALGTPPGANQVFIAEFGFTNTASLILTINGTALTVKIASAAGLRNCTGGEATAGNPGEFFYDGTNLVLLNAAAGIAALGVGGVANLSIANVGGFETTRRLITADAATLADGSNNTITILNVSVTLNTGITGAGGMDVGGAPTAAPVHEYIIAQAGGLNPTALGSLSATAPTMPAGYTLKLRVGFCPTVAAAFYRVKTTGPYSQFLVGAGNTLALPILISGVSGSTSIPTWTAQSVSALLGTTTLSAGFVFTMQTATPGNGMAAPNGSYGAITSTTNPPPIAFEPGVGNAGGAITGWWMLESTSVYYASAGASNALALLGWIDNVNPMGGSGGGVSGVTSLAGGTNIAVSGATGAVTVSLAGQVAPTAGGSGVSTLTAHGVLLGQGTGNFTAVAPTTSGKVLTAQGNTSDPIYASQPYDPIMTLSDNSTVITTGTNVAHMRIPRACTIASLTSNLKTADNSAVIVDIKKNGTSIFTTNLLQIDSGATTSVGSGSPYNLTTTALAANDLLTFDITAVGTAGVGLEVNVLCNIP